MVSGHIIAHLDLDAFFCAVEALRDPSLRGQPFAVGGRPERRMQAAVAKLQARFGENIIWQGKKDHKRGK